MQSFLSFFFVCLGLQEGEARELFLSNALYLNANLILSVDPFLKARHIL